MSKGGGAAQRACLDHTRQESPFPAAYVDKTDRICDLHGGFSKGQKMGFQKVKQMGAATAQDTSFKTLAVPGAARESTMEVNTKPFGDALTRLFERCAGLSMPHDQAAVDGFPREPAANSLTHLRVAVMTRLIPDTSITRVQCEQSLEVRVRTINRRETRRSAMTLTVKEWPGVFNLEMGNSGASGRMAESVLPKLSAEGFNVGQWNRGV